MRRWLGALVLVACAASACSVSAGGSATVTATPAVSASPTTMPSTGPTVIQPTSARPSGLYSQEQVGKGEYQLINNRTQQFIEATGGRARKACSSAGAGCSDYLLIGVTAYAGNTKVVVSPSQFALANPAGRRYLPAPGRQATRVVQPTGLLQTTELQPDDDTDFASGTLVIAVPPGAGRFSLVWRGHHVATLVKTDQGKLYETR